MQWEFEGVVLENCAVVFRTAEPFGELSNMHNGFPLRVGGRVWKSSEALYQACRYPHRPDWQLEIWKAPHAVRAKMAAKKEGRRHHSRPDWDVVRVSIMRWCLRLKFRQHRDRLLEVLARSEGRAIVERSRRDRFWGAVLDTDGVLRGENWLGRLWMELRDEVFEGVQPAAHLEASNVPWPEAVELAI